MQIAGEVCEPGSHIVQKCLSTIRTFVDTVLPTRYSTNDVRGTELLAAENLLNQRWKDFELLSPDEWMVMRSQLSRADGMCLWHYSIRMAEMAVRRDDACFIGFALAALVVDESYTESRDFVAALGLILDAAKRVNADAVTLFKSAAKHSSPQRRERIQFYVTERAHHTSMAETLEGLGYQATGTKEDFKYRTKL